MAVVWVTPEASASPRSGGGLRSVRLLQAVAARTPTHVVCLGQPGDAGAFLAATAADSVRWFTPDRSAIAVRLDALRHGWPLDLARWRDPAAARAVDSLAAHGCTVVVEHLRLAPYRVRGRRWVALLHNVDSEWHRELRVPARGWRRVEAALDDLAMRRAERRLLAEPGATVVAASARDAALLGVPASVVPNGCDVPDAPPPMSPTGTLLFVGSLEYEPNRDAVRWWADAIWPALPAGTPPLTVVGRGGARALGLADGIPGLELVGEVDDVGPHLRRARAVVIPLRQGSGTRLKLLEAMAWARPVVSTSKGAEGIDVRSGVDILLADDPSTFAQATVAVLDDDALAARLAAAGRLVAERHDWRTIAPAFADVVLNVR